MSCQRRRLAGKVCAEFAGLFSSALISELHRRGTPQPDPTPRGFAGSEMELDSFWLMLKPSFMCACSQPTLQAPSLTPRLIPAAEELRSLGTKNTPSCCTQRGDAARQGLQEGVLLLQSTLGGFQEVWHSKCRAGDRQGLWITRCVNHQDI